MQKWHLRAAKRDSLPNPIDIFFAMHLHQAGDHVDELKCSSGILEVAVDNMMDNWILKLKPINGTYVFNGPLRRANDVGVP